MDASDTHGRSHRARRPGTGAALALAAGIGVVASGALVYQASYAAFTATAENTGNSWETGSVDLTDDDGGSALFSTATDGLLQGGETGTRCLTVTSSGSLESTVTMSASASGALAADIDLTVERGDATPTGPGDCTGFTGSTVYSGALGGLEAALVATPETWTSTADPVRTYRITWSLPDGDDVITEGATASATFTWHATS